MYIFTKEYLEKIAKEKGFIRDTIEKTLRLIEVVGFINSDQITEGKLALKGGTAINLLSVPLLRLSVDIDLDFTINEEKEELQKLRDSITKRLNNFMGQQGYSRKAPAKEYHALFSQEYRYLNSGGNRDTIKIEINFMNRTHVLPLEKKEIIINTEIPASPVLTLNTVELYASKINALLSRATPRDLYDVFEMIDKKVIKDQEMLRKCFIFYKVIGGSPLDRSIDLDIIDKIDDYAIKTRLRPVLSKADKFNFNEAKIKVKNYLAKLMDLSDQEKLFLYKFIEEKEYLPSLLFEDERIIARIQSHPMALWRQRRVEVDQEEDVDSELEQ